jgi:hypothetical protein
LAFDYATEEKSSVTLIEIRPHRNGLKVFEAPGVEPIFPQKHQATNYAENRGWFRSGEIRILDSSGNVERAIQFTEAMSLSCLSANDAIKRSQTNACA